MDTYTHDTVSLAPAAPAAAIPSAYLTLLTRIIRSVARAHRLSQEDAEDFGQTVHLKLLERGYDVFHSFEGRSSLSTYLHVVVTRLLLDWRNAVRGKWRPSAAARRLGADGIALERLMYRDGLTRTEAVASLVSQQARPGDERALTDLAASLPARAPRTFVSDAAAHDVTAVGFEDPVAAEETRLAARHVRSRLRRAYSRLSPDDRRLIGMRFGSGLTVQAIGQRLNADPKPLYRRIERSLATLRRTLAGNTEPARRAMPRGRARRPEVRS